MTASANRKDLIVLVPGKDEAAVIRGLLARTRTLRIRSLLWEIQFHPDRDAGCRLKAHEFLRRESGRFEHALVVFDSDGCGAENIPRQEVETEVEQRLSSTGWGDRAAVVVIDPELEAWVWSDTPHVDEALGWKGRKPSLRDWLRSNRLLRKEESKPGRPKEAMEAALRAAAKKRSSAIYGYLAAKVSLQRCADPSFLRFKQVLTNWFGRDLKP